VVTNLPYEALEELATHLTDLGARDHCAVALLLRAEWIVPKARRKLIHEHPHFAGAVMLTARPRWAEKTQDSKSPRHNFAWGVWGPTPRVGYPWLRFAGRDGRPEEGRSGPHRSPLSGAGPAAKTATPASSPLGVLSP
jgi:hypothetical protein